jgi:hypothetical protein
MAIALQGTASVYENASTTSAVVNYPAGITAGELLVTSLTVSQSSAMDTPPTGWTLARAQNGSTTPSVSMFYKVASGSETGTVTFGPWSSAGRATAIMARWSGVDNTTPLDTTAVSATSIAATSFVMPSITTATAGAVLVHALAINSSTAEIDTSAGTTLIAKSTTDIGRRHGQWYETRATAGATGTRTWTCASSREWAGITLALRPGTGGGGGGGGGGGTITPTLTQRNVGIPTANTSTSAVVQVKVANATSVRLKVSTDAAGTQGVVFGSAVTPTPNGDAKLTVSGLTANTRYYYRIAMTADGGEVLDTAATIGRLKTAPSGQANFAFTFGSCNTGTDVTAVNAMAARNDDMFLMLGDLYYADGTTATTANFRNSMNSKIVGYQALLATTNSAYTPSDHDGFTNNSAAGSDATAWANWNTVRSELWPAATTYYTWVWGRVRFIILDDRSFKSNPADTDNSSKTALGATQKAWLKSTITAATEPVIVIGQSSPWIGSPDVGDDGWFGYTTERGELADFFAASGKNIAMLAGDMHALAADNGTNSPGGIAVFQAAPFNGTSSIKGGPYSTAPYPSSSGQGVSQYGRIVVTDTGNQISLAFSGYTAATNTERVAMTKTYNVTAPAGGGTGKYVPSVFVNTPTGWVSCNLATA